MKSKYSLEDKRLVIELQEDKKVNQLNKALFIAYQNEDMNACFEIADKIHEIEHLDCAKRLIYSQYMKARKVREKIQELVSSDSAIFITLTFNDKTLAKTSFETRRRYVARYLKDNCSVYVANVDYGKENGREHYHAVVDNSFIIQKKWKYGFEDAEPIGHRKKYQSKSASDNSKAISKYITKLTNHALKNKGLQPRLIYSRNTI